jgi:hypothetical protein
VILGDQSQGHVPDGLRCQGRRARRWLESGETSSWWRLESGESPSLQWLELGETLTHQAGGVSQHGPVVWAASGGRAPLSGRWSRHTAVHEWLGTRRWWAAATVGGWR